MSKTTFQKAFLVLFLLWSCSSSRTATQEVDSKSKDDPKLSIGASPRQGFTPLRVTLRAKLEGVNENDQQYYCLQEEWDFGDGSKSTEQPNCDAFAPETKIKTEFFVEHVYEKHGNYGVRLVLGDKKIRSKQVTVSAVERNRSMDEDR